MPAQLRRCRLLGSLCFVPPLYPCLRLRVRLHDSGGAAAHAVRAPHGRSCAVPRVLCTAAGVHGNSDVASPRPIALPPALCTAPDVASSHCFAPCCVRSRILRSLPLRMSAVERKAAGGAAAAAAAPQASPPPTPSKHAKAKQSQSQQQTPQALPPTLFGNHAATAAASSSSSNSGGSSGGGGSGGHASRSGRSSKAAASDPSTSPPAVRESWEISPSEIHVAPDAQPIGEGFFGVVYKAVWRDIIVCVKRLKSVRGGELANFQKELSLCTQLRHPHLVQFLAASTTKGNLCIVTEWMQGGSLYSFIHEGTRVGGVRYSRSDLDMLLRIASEVARACIYLHAARIAHRDLTSSNILLDENLRAKVSLGNDTGD